MRFKKHQGILDIRVLILVRYFLVSVRRHKSTLKISGADSLSFFYHSNCGIKVKLGGVHKYRRKVYIVVYFLMYAKAKGRQYGSLSTMYILCSLWENRIDKLGNIGIRIILPPEENILGRARCPFDFDTGQHTNLVCSQIPGQDQHSIS